MREFILTVLKPFKFLIVMQLLCGLIWAIDLSIRPYILKLIIDKIGGFSNYNGEYIALIKIITLYVFISFLIIIVLRIQDFIWLKIIPPLRKEIYEKLMQKMLHHSLEIYQRDFSGNLASKVKDVVGNIPSLFKLIINQFFSHFVALFIAIYTVSTINYIFSFLMLLWACGFFIGSFFLAKKAKYLSYKVSEIRSYITGQIVDIFSNISTVLLFTIQSQELKRLSSSLDTTVQVEQRKDLWFLILFSFQGFSFILYQALSFTFFLFLLKIEKITAGDIALLITINISITGALQTLALDIMSFAELTGSIKQGLQTALLKFKIQDNVSSKDLEINKGEIAFNDVKFYYGNSSTCLFNKKTVLIEGKSKVGFVGYSGSGKSTFVNLLLRVYEIIGGEILIDGQDIRSVTQASLRNNISIISQDLGLFNRSILENIRCGRHDANDEEVILAAKKAHAHQFISQLPEEYMSLIGERGVKLSGGQRQRIAIARAILKNAPILILDEATSQLDLITEKYIYESIWELMKNKTTIVIAHRLSTLVSMDRILVFNEGTIVEDGNHENLLKKNGLYRQLWGVQQKEL